MNLVGPGIATLYRMLTNDSGTFTISDLVIDEKYSIEIGAVGYVSAKVTLDPLTENKLPLTPVVLKKSVH